MSRRYIITLMAANRVGILSAVTTAMAELGGDLQEVSQTVLQRFFTIILAAEFPEHREPQVIADHLRDVCRPYGVEVALKDPAAETMQAAPDETFDRYFLTVEGHDEPGIIREISTRLAQDEIDITDLHAVRSDEDRSFVMVMELAVPPAVDVLALRPELEHLGKAVGLSVTMQHENIFAATNDPRPVRVGLEWGESALEPSSSFDMSNE
jgi:glycine cleavage system transcriptional repressor